MPDTAEAAPPPRGSDPSFTRRALLAGALPTAGVALAAPAAAATLDGGEASSRVANILDFGARGDGIADDSPALQKALAAAPLVEIPAGSYRISGPLKLRDGQVVRGIGRSGWEPYSSKGPMQSAVHTEIVVDGGLAFDARNTNNVAISGLAIRARKASQSPWGGEPGFQAGTIGIDITGAYQFDANDISFHGLETGVISIADQGRPTQMPHIGNWTANDCEVVFRFVSTREDFQVVRDARIEGCIAAIHCRQVVHARHCDGIRIENVRFFQCSLNSILVENTPFVCIVGATLFETTFETIILRNCSYVTISGAQFARAGYFKSGKLLQQASVILDKCSDVSFSGLVEQPIGRAFTITDCTNIAIQGTIGMPYWSTGNLASHDGAIRIERSRAISINAAFSGLGYWIAVWSDAVSAGTISGNIATEGAAGVVRCLALQPPPLSQVIRTATARQVAAKSAAPLETLRILLPPNKSLVTRAVESTAPHFILEVGGERWQPSEKEPGGGSLSLARKALDTNMGSEPRYASIEIRAHNPTDAGLTLPAGYELRLSLALE